MVTLVLSTGARVSRVGQPGPHGAEQEGELESEPDAGGAHALGLGIADGPYRCSNDNIVVSVDGGLLRHNLGTATGFNSANDFDSAVAGDHTLTTPRRSRSTAAPATSSSAVREPTT
jgi:hypothetical protein